MIFWGSWESRLGASRRSWPQCFGGGLSGNKFSGPASSGSRGPPNMACTWQLSNKGSIARLLVSKAIVSGTAPKVAWIVSTDGEGRGHRDGGLFVEHEASSSGSQPRGQVLRPKQAQANRSKARGDRRRQGTTAATTMLAAACLVQANKQQHTSPDSEGGNGQGGRQNLRGAGSNLHPHRHGYSSGAG